MKLTPEIKRNVAEIAIGTVILSVAMLIIFAVVKRFDSTVMIGAGIGGILAVGNFFFMARTIARAADNAASETKVKTKAQLGYMGRQLATLLIVVLAIVVLKVNVLAVALPLLFPSITIRILQLVGYYKKGGE